MSMRRIIQQMIATFSLLAIARKYKNRASLMKIKAAQVYVLGVKKARIFFLGIVLVSVAVVFLINGLSLVQAAFFTYSTWSNDVKYMVALSLGCVEAIGAVSILVYLFKEETWGKFTEIHQVVNSAVNDKK